MLKDTREIQAIKATDEIRLYDEIVIFERKDGSRYAELYRGDIMIGKAEIKRLL